MNIMKLGNLKYDKESTLEQDGINISPKSF